MYQRVSVIGVGIATVKQASQNLSLAAPLVFLATSKDGNPNLNLNPVSKEMLETQTETDTYLAKFLKA